MLTASLSALPAFAAAEQDMPFSKLSANEQLSEDILRELVAFESTVEKPDEVKKLINNAVERFGQLDCLINNAGYHPPVKVIDSFTVADLEDAHAILRKLIANASRDIAHPADVMNHEHHACGVRPLWIYDPGIEERAIGHLDIDPLAMTRRLGEGAGGVVGRAWWKTVVPGHLDGRLPGAAAAPTLCVVPTG